MLARVAVETNREPLPAMLAVNGREASVSFHRRSAEPLRHAATTSRGRRRVTANLHRCCCRWPNGEGLTAESLRHLAPPRYRPCWKRWRFERRRYCRPAPAVHGDEGTPLPHQRRRSPLLVAPPSIAHARYPRHCYSILDGRKNRGPLVEEEVNLRPAKPFRTQRRRYLLHMLARCRNRLFQVDLNNVIQGLAKDSKLLNSTKAAHSKESLEGEVEREYLLDLGKADYGMGYQDAQKEIFGLLKARDVTFSPTSWGLLNPVTPNDTQGAENVALNALVDTLGGEIPMDNAILESAANVDSVVGMDRAAVPTLTEVDRSDVAATGEEEDPSDAL
nr:MAP7 domain-containing protein 1-like [Ipomoea batatas]